MKHRIFTILATCCLSAVGGIVQSAPIDGPRFFGWDQRPQIDSFRDTRPTKHDETDTAHSGIVLSTINAPGVNTTYIELSMHSRQVWVASRITQVNAGDKVAFSPSEAITMENFESRALKRSFEQIFFVPDLTIVERAKQ